MYIASVDAINDRFPNALHVLSHNIGIGIEFALKAFLMHHGMTERDLRRLGHDLEALLAEAQQHGLSSTGSRHFRLAILGANYEERIFVYPQKGVLNCIVPARLREIAHEIICEVFATVKGKEQLDALKDEPGLSIKSTYPEDVNPGAWKVHP